MGLLARAVSSLLDCLAPPCCAACDAPTHGAFCDACAPPALGARGRKSASLLEGVPLLVAGPYEPPLSTAIVRFKYGGRPELARALAPLLGPALARLELAPGTALVPVPLHARRLAARGYNQAALLAQELARFRQLACEPRLLERARETEQQVGKARAERLTNANHAFVLRKARRGGVILVDDVVTTGSTVRACAQALAQGGVELTAVVALAVALPG